MAKTFIIFLFLSNTHLFSQGTKYLDVIKKGELLYFISNHGIEIMSNEENTNRFFMKHKISKQIVGTPLFTVNDSYIFLKANDSLFLYENDGVNFEQLVGRRDGYYVFNIYPWGNDFLAKASSNFAILRYNNGIIQKIIDTSLSIISLNDVIVYPYVIKNFRDIYKYLEDFGLSYTYFIPHTTDPGIEFMCVKGSKEILYYIFVPPDHGGFPPFLNLRIRSLISPDFNMTFNIYGWGSTFAILYEAIVADSRYIIFRRQDSDLMKIVDYNQYEFLNYSNLHDNYKIIGKYIIKLDSSLSYSWTHPVNFSPLIPIITSALSDDIIKLKFTLNQNFPNPFNPVTVISYELPALSKVRLTVYDILGNVVAKLVDEEKQPGTYEVQFDASSLSSGIYFYRLQAGSFIETKKMILLR